MSNNFVRVVKNVFSNRNILVIAITTSLISLTDMGWRPFWGLYLKNELGADMMAIGLLSTIATSDRLLFQLPGGLLADRFGRRKIIVIGTALRLIPPIFYLLAGHWTHVIPAVLISGAASVYMPAFNAIIADSLPEEERGAGYGAYRTITATPQIFSPLIGGYLMDMFGYREGVKIFLIVSFIVTIFVTYTRWKVLQETLDNKENQKTIDEENKTWKEQISGSFELPRSIWAMVVVSLFGSFGLRMVWDFMPLYAIEIIGLTNTQWGLIQTTSGIVAAILAMPGGMLSDRLGRKPLILVSRLVSPITIYATTIATSFEMYYPISIISAIGNALGGGGMFVGGPAWNALIADLVPREKRGTVMGTMGTLSGLVATPSSWIGGYLWDAISPQTPFYVTLVLGLIGTTIFYFGVKEPPRSTDGG